MFKKWYNTPAEWYHFWLPQSGLFGGVIMGLILAIPFIILGTYGRS